jgi:hypothetical protein
MTPIKHTNPLPVDHIDTINTAAGRATAMLNAVICCKGEANFWRMNDGLQDAYLGMIESLIEQMNDHAGHLFDMAKANGAGVKS